jgi:predicted acylesterase/phospholipase RssA
MAAIKTPEELLRDICVNTVSTDYMLTGEMKRQGVSWFPSIYKMAQLWFKTGQVIDSQEFLRCCRFYYSDITFEEAYEMTKKHVCITVTASRASSGSGVQRLLLNHISTPTVTLASAVAASCAVPGIFLPAKLMIKDSRGKLAPFEVDGKYKRRRRQVYMICTRMWTFYSNSYLFLTYINRSRMDRRKCTSGSAI